MIDLSIRLLGPFQVEAEGEPVAGFASDRVRALLAYLATESDQPHRRDKLAGLLWPNCPQKTARTNLRRALADLRKSISDHQAKPPYLLITRQTIQFNSASHAWIDVDIFVFSSTADTIHLPLDEQTIQQLEDAVILYRSHFLEGFYLDDSLEFEEWALLKRERFQRQMLVMLHRLAAHYEEAGDYERALPHAWRQVEIDPFQETAQRQVIRLLALTGQRAQALTQYETLKCLLDEEMGMAPEARTTTLYEKIQVGDLDLAISITPRVRGYELHEQIGMGRHGAVYRAVQSGVNREVAVKVILPQYANQPDFIRRFETEAQLVARLEHPHIVPLYDYWREADGAFLVMRWLRCGNLQTALANGPVSLETAVTFIEQIAAALTAAHRQGVVHRDLKPVNILLDEDGNAYLSDFGIAKDSKREIDQLPTDIIISPSTAISPEQILNEPVTPLTDLYSLGLVAYEMLTGSHPFAGLSLAEAVDRYLLKSIPRVRSQRGDMPPQIDDVIQRATMKQPTDRYPDVLTFAAAFRQAADINGVGQIPPTTKFVGTELENPYRGLHAFQEADAEIFFGRSAFTQQLISHLTETRFLAVIGPSGSGKSSVVKAGVIPALRQGGIPDSENWFIVEMKPRTQPLRELENALMPVAVNPPPNLLGPLQKDSHGLQRVLKRIMPVNAHGEASQLLLIIDQFEELFTQVEDNEERQHFLDNLLAAMQTPPSQLRIIITLRADFYDKPLQIPLLGELLRQHAELVLPLTSAELEQAVLGPADAVGVTIEPQLAAAIMADIQGQPGSLPLLQYALTELFERRQGNTMSLTAYKDIGGIAGALSRRAEKLYEALDENGQAAARQLFLRLITLGEEDGYTQETAVTRRRVNQSELAALQASDVENVIDGYGRYRLLTFDRNPVTREPTVEIAHEALLHEWPCLRNWLDESRSDIRQQQLLTSAAAEWLKADQNEGYLLHGARMAQFSGWAENSTVALTREEQEFLAASQSAQQKQHAEEEARRQQELETAQQLADTERQRAEEQAKANRRLRWRALLLAAALMVAAILAVLANSASRRANENALSAQNSAALATTREAEALTETEQRTAAEYIAVQEREEAQEQGRQAQARALAGAAINNIQVDPELGVLLALQAVETTHDVDGTWMPEAVDALHHTIQSASRLQRVWHNPAGAMNWVRYSPDGSLLGASTLLADQEIMTTVWNAKTGQELFTLPTSITTFSADNKRLMTWHSANKNLYWDIWDATNAEKIETINLFIDDLEYSAGGALSLDWQYFALRYWDNTINVWDMSTKERILHSTEHDGMVNSVVFSPDNRYLATASQDGTAKVWRVPVGNQDLKANTDSILTLEHAAAVEVLAFSPDSRYLATVSRDQTAVIWNIKASIVAGSPVRVFTFPLTGHAESITQITFNNDGSLLAVVSQDGLVKIWDTNTGEGLMTFVSNDLTRSIAFDPDGTHLVTVNDGGLVQLWDISPSGEKEWLTLTGHDSTVNRATYSPDGTHLATISSDETIKIWDAASGDLIRTLVGHTDDVRAVTFCPDASCLTTGSNDGTIKFWDLAAGHELSTLDAYTGLDMNPIPENNVLDLAYTPDGSRLISVGMDNVPDVWDPVTGERIMSLEDHWYNVVSTAVSPDGQYIATTGPDGMMIIWDSETGKQIFNQQTTEYGSKDVAFSPDSGRLATGDNDGAIRVWDLHAQEGERLLMTLSGHGSLVQSVAFSPNGRYLASASANQIRIWDAETGQPLFTLPGHTRVVLDIEFSPDGNYLVSASADGTARIYVMSIEALMDLARSRLTRSLTEAECQRYLHVETCAEAP